MKITKILETTVPLKSNLRDGVLDCNEMTTSVVAVSTDVVRHCGPAVGLVFNATVRGAASTRGMFSAAS